MVQEWYTLTETPSETTQIIFDDQDFFRHNFKAFTMAAEIESPLRAELTVVFQDPGFLIEGTFSGKILLNCDRCAAKTPFSVDIRISLYEEPGDENDGDIDGEVALLRENDGAIELNVAELLWQELNLVLPVKVLCDTECKGLCPECGVNLNNGECSCEKDEGDPRLAVLRNLKIQK